MSIKEQSDSMIRRAKTRLMIVVALGIVTMAVMVLVSLAFGPVDMSFSEAISALISAIQKGGDPSQMTKTETIVYSVRLPRVIGVIAVGIGLAIAGCVYQAIIRNPMVDPYITGVSSGAGLGATAAMLTGLTFFGSYSIYGIPIAAMVGGLAAFAFTMVIAEGSGGSPINYVLGGVIVGMAFGSFTTLLLTFAGHKLQGVLFWMFGSFAQVTWDQAWLILLPVVGLTLVVLVYARDLNLVLLGEEQARQMGLNVRRFNRAMLVLASILTAICVAFTGIIGFVGLIVPHACRMILGGDHRFVLPASIVLGANVMMVADLIAKLAVEPVELPVGAITTLIGAPFFAYLLIRRGKGYGG